MVRGLVGFLGREVRGLHEAAYVLGAFALCSQLLALLRDRLFASSFGAGETLDVYYAAFRIPDLLFASLASLASIYVLIPLISEKMQASEEAVRSFLSGVWTTLFAGMSAIALLACIAAPYFVPLLFPGFSAFAQETTTLLTRIMLLQPLLLGLSNLAATVTQLRGRFVLYATSPLLYNIGIIIGLLAFYPVLGISGLAWGVVLGALLHLGLQIPFVVSQGYFPRTITFLPRGDLVRIITTSLPRTLTLTLNQGVLFVLMALGSTLTAGSISVFQFAMNLQFVPLSIIGVSYSVAAFPTLSKLFVAGERDAFTLQIVTAARHILFWSIPAVVLIIVLRAQLVRVILGAGAFDWSDTRLTAAALALFALSLVEQAMLLLLVRGFYAAGNTRIPLLVGIGSSIMAIASAFVFLWLFRVDGAFRAFVESLLRVTDIPGTEVLALPLAFVVGVGVNALILMVLFQRRHGEVRAIVRSTVSVSVAASLAAGAVAYTTLALMDDVVDIQTTIGIFTQGLVAGIAGIVTWITALSLLGSAELEEAKNTLARRAPWRRGTVVPESE